MTRIEIAQLDAGPGLTRTTKYKNLLPPTWAVSIERTTPYSVEAPKTMFTTIVLGASPAT